MQVSIADVDSSVSHTLRPGAHALRWDLLQPDARPGRTVIVTASSTDTGSTGSSTHSDDAAGVAWRHWVPLFPLDKDAYAYEPAVHSSASSDADPLRDQKGWRCYLVYFDIKQEYVDDYKKILLDECLTVFNTERGMRRYDLLQALDNPCHFLVYEIAEDEAAMAVHEGRRSDGSMRRILADMEAVSRKSIEGTGGYAILGPADPRRIGWPQRWRGDAAPAGTCARGGDVTERL
jgi:quinol monooxygenase YgiN